ncbi:hypothetical protein, partial [Microbacterium sp. HMWF026]|uniref:hypothetical protein n=1 Tax=Microbacterium sp. HMWF026 TaxID=2056861 RepID=UPI0015E7F68D
SAPSRRRPRRSTIVLGAALAAVLVATGAGAFWAAGALDDARGEIRDQQRRLEEQQREIDQQREVIERKEEFGLALGAVEGAVAPLVGLPYASLVPWDRIDAVVEGAWSHRWSADALALDTDSLRDLADDLTTQRSNAEVEAATNATGTAWEAALDQLGSGWVSTRFMDVSTECGADAMACVWQAEPFVVRVGDHTRSDPTLTDWIRTGVAYHEFAHVLQFTNPGPTQAALGAFGGDVETMADCYALTELDGWSLHHEVPIDEVSLWEVSVGYGVTCDDAQRARIREWVSSVGVQRHPDAG